MTSPSFAEMAFKICENKEWNPDIVPELADVLKQVHNEALEEAAKIAIDVGNYRDDVYGPSAGQYIAKAIRELKEVGK